jgi:hypothetical protein
MADLRRIVGRLAVAGLVAGSSMSALAIAAQSGATADAATHKQWMDDASDAQEDFRFALGDKDAKAAGEALTKLESLMAKTEEYWTAKKAADGVKLAKDTRALLAQASAAAKAGNLPGASQAFDKMGASCNACHDLHLEKRR